MPGGCDPSHSSPPLPFDLIFVIQFGYLQYSSGCRSPDFFLEVFGALVPGLKVNHGLSDRVSAGIYGLCRPESAPSLTPECTARETQPGRVDTVPIFVTFHALWHQSLTVSFCEMTVSVYSPTC